MPESSVRQAAKARRDERVDVPCAVACRPGGRFHRVVFADAADDALRGVRTAEGRFHHDGQPALYLSPYVEWAERAMNRYRSAGDPPRVAVPLDVGPAAVADLRAAEDCAAWGVDPRDVVAEWWRQRDEGRPKDSWRAADAVCAGGADGMVYPSRGNPVRWHLVLFRWNGTGGPTISVAGPPIALVASDCDRLGEGRPAARRQA